MQHKTTVLNFNKRKLSTSFQLYSSPYLLWRLPQKTTQTTEVYLRIWIRKNREGGVMPTC